MHSRIAEALALKHSPVAVLLTDARPEGAIQFKEGTRGCAGAMLLAAAHGLGFGNEESFLRAAAPAAHSPGAWR